jgi:metallo-beta-lactamase family protein
MEIMKLSFMGAARIVTGSCYLLETAGKKLLVDCGMYQGTKDITRRNYEPFGFDPREISFLLLTHAHIDHSGLIPKLMKNGFRGRIIATPPTIDLVKIMLEDAATVNEEETRNENKRRERMGLPPRQPIYTLKDVKACFGLFKPLEYDREFDVANGIRMRYRNAGHILGSGIIELWAREKGKETKIVFSGDLGQWETPLVDNPTIIPDADYVLVESTYGNRLHGEVSTRGDLLSETVKETFERGGKLMIPSFAVERTQELLYYLHQLVRDREFPKEKIFLDSPLAINATKVFSKNMRYFSPRLREEFSDPFEFKGLNFLRSAQESMTMNDYRAPCVIIAGNGMCSAGRIRHHLKHNLWKKQNTLLFVGYQAQGSLGRVILEGAEIVKMMGMEIAVNAQIRQIDSFSSHADSNELLKWMGGFERKPRRVFVIHGEEESSMGLADTLAKRGFETHVPVLGETVELS